MFALVGAVEKFAVKQLNADYSKDELKQQINDQNIDYILQRANNAIENSFQLGNSFDGF